MIERRARGVLPGHDIAPRSQRGRLTTSKSKAGIFGQARRVRRFHANLFPNCMTALSGVENPAGLGPAPTA